MNPWLSLAAKHREWIDLPKPDHIVRSTLAALHAHAKSTRNLRLFEAPPHDQLRRRTNAQGLSEFQLGGEDGIRLKTEEASDNPVVENARLHVLLLVDRTAKALRKFTVEVRGINAADAKDWTLAVHFDATPMGHGACSHALLHCHLGPEAFDEPKIRTPFPADLGPGDVITWVLTQCLPADLFEPAPWPLEDNNA